MDKLLNVVPQEPSKEIAIASFNDVSHSSIANIPNIETNKQLQLNTNYMNRQVTAKRSDDNVRINNPKYLLMNQNAFNQINNNTNQPNTNNNNVSLSNSNSASIRSSEIVQEPTDDPIKNNNNNMIFDNKCVLNINNNNLAIPTSSSLTANSGLLLQSTMCVSPLHKDVLLKTTNNTNEISMKELIQKIDMLSFQQQQSNLSPFNPTIFGNLDTNPPHPKTPSTTSHKAFSNFHHPTETQIN